MTDAPNNFCRLASSANELLRQLQGLSTQPATPMAGIEQLDEPAFEALYRELQASAKAGPLGGNAKLRPLLADAYSCLQLARGFLAASAGASQGLVVRFEVGGIPVSMPPASANAMRRDAQRLLRALRDLG